MDDATITGAIRDEMIAARRRGLIKGHRYSDLVAEVAAQLALPEDAVRTAVDGEITAGRLYWRNPRYPCRLKLADPVPSKVAEPVERGPVLW